MRRKKLVWLLVGVMFALHQDFWLWDDPTLLLGFLPVGLAYHAAYSVALAAMWYYVIQVAWPEELERFAQGAEENLAQGPAGEPGQRR